MDDEKKNAPLFGFPWNQAEMDRTFNRGLVTLVAFDDQEKAYGIGTGFVVSHDDTKAVCITAAHVITEIRNIQAPPLRHARSALQEFLPPPRAIDLSRQKVRAISIDGERVEALAVENAIVDEARDIAIITVALQNDESASFFDGEFEVDDSIPQNGALICILSYGDLATDNPVSEDESCRRFVLKQRPILRVGTVVEHYPNGHRLCNGPCIETTIPVYSGMSGGPVFAFAMDGPIRPIGLVCSDPDLDGPDKENRTKSGSSIVALLPCSIEINEAGQRVGKFVFPDAEAAGEIRNLVQPIRDKAAPC
ncbi:S1 family peptidase [Herbaspirillum rubrisubalbicans]|uniref:Serine protease n=1 Tax=Herbaspirillum rubrisubalbicans TaxID=80842 RepID=A0AAD0UAW3_9BURK|nr:serine protease [Herbaspirillum rubrisubalbicans]AYR23559.1 serine protease [Herbaspirillum rubrisubalbicans]